MRYPCVTHVVASMNYCSECGGRVAVRWIEGEQRDRAICTHCGMTHFENPKVLVTCLAHWNGRLVMCRRAHDPAVGLWTPPGGFMERGETLEMAAAREAAEEAGLIVDPAKLIPYSITTLTNLAQIYISFRIEIPEPQLLAGPESLEVALFSEADMPWDQIAFSEAPSFFRLFFKEQRTGQFSIHISQSDDSGRARRGFRIIDPDQE